MKRQRESRNSNFLEAEDLLRLCRMGKMRVIKEHTPNGPIVICVSKSGAITSKVPRDYIYMFEPFWSEYGNRDGFFGDQQTTALVSDCLGFRDD